MHVLTAHSFINSFLCTVRHTRSSLCRHVGYIWPVAAPCCFTPTDIKGEGRQKIFLWMRRVLAAVQETVYILVVGYAPSLCRRRVDAWRSTCIGEDVQNLRLRSCSSLMQPHFFIVYLHKTSYIHDHLHETLSLFFSPGIETRADYRPDTNVVVCTSVLNRGDLFFAVFRLRFRPINYHSESRKPSSVFSMPAQLT